MSSLKYAMASLITALLSMTNVSAHAAEMTISGTPPAMATVGEQYDFRPVVKNANRSKLEFSYVNLPTWSPRYRSCGCLIGVPNEPGVYANIRIQVWDGEHFAQTPPFTITVRGTQAAPPTPAPPTPAPSPVPVPSIVINATPNTVSSGQSTTINWTATNATSCAASGGWSGAQSVGGTRTISGLSASTTFMLTCTGSGGSKSNSATVKYTPPVPAPPVSAGLDCTSSKGALTLNARVVRAVGVSPLLVFFDAVGTTDTSISANATTFQDVQYTWSFGDFGTSGTGTWQYGSNPNRNSKNTASGGVAAHLYITPGSDTAYVATVTATDGANTTSCQLAITAYDPTSANGFAGNATTCVASASTPVAGSNGCPAGAAVMRQSDYASALNGGSISGRRILFKCGDSFTGNVIISATKWSIGAYGGCEGTQSNRPIITNQATTYAGTTQISMTSGDGRISDLDFESAGNSNGAVQTGYHPPEIPYQITMWNLKSNGNKGGYSWNWGAQFGLIGSTQTNVNPGYIATFINASMNVPGGWTGNQFNNLDYQAVIGNYFDGPGLGSSTQSSSGVETVRVSAGRLMVFEDSTFLNANATGAVLKIHNGDGGNELPWTGIWTEYVEISDNYFGGTSAAALVETAPQGSPDDERLRNIVTERNLFAGSTEAMGGRQLLVSAQNETVRDNVFSMVGSPSTFPIYGVQVTQLSSTLGVPASNNEVYNNTCYAPSSISGQTCVGFTAVNGGAAAVNSTAKNNLFFSPGNTGPAVADKGTGNTVSNNTTSVVTNPGFTNGTGSLSIITDFKPTSNYSGGVNVPVWNDALGTPWQPTWDLGALHH